jgi:F-type H+-transporting ATPase subunit gamma
MADEERIKDRLDNIRSVEPILGAMRTISLGSWQAAINRRGRLQRYSQRLLAILPPLIPRLHAHAGDRGRTHGLTIWNQLRGLFPGESQAEREASSAPILVVTIGSERGLCGAFNSSLVQRVSRVLTHYESIGIEVELGALGARAERALRRVRRKVSWSVPLPMTTLPSHTLAYELTRSWLERYESHELNAVELMYNAYRSSTLYEPILRRLIPPPVTDLPVDGQRWPPPYIDTDPIALYTRVIRLWVAVEMYRILLDSAASEHSARYQLMEGATQNANRLISELTLALQASRQAAITQEMQELAAGAGLLGEEEG